MAFGVDKKKLAQKLESKERPRSSRSVMTDNRESASFSMSSRLMEDIDRLCKGKNMTRTEYFEAYLLKYYDSRTEKLLFSTDKKLADRRKTINMRLEAGLLEALKTLSLEKNKTAGELITEMIERDEEL